MMVERTYKNTLLNHLGPEITERLDLQPITFEMRHEIEFPGKPVDRLYFLESGMASMTATFLDGAQVEVTMFGFESVIGVSALMGTRKSLHRVYTQIPGHGYFCTAQNAEREFEQCGRFQKLVLRYVQAQLSQALQLTACNIRHSLDQRLARWLLTCGNRTDTLSLRLNHELLSDMLGSARPTVSLAAAKLRSEGLIDYSRGLIKIVDPSGLCRRTCECYGIIQHHLESCTEFDTDFVS
jgi:CRP-like cAMP-binding protein